MSTAANVPPGSAPAGAVSASATEAALHRELDGREFDVIIRRLATSLDLGSDQSLHLGSGTDYAQSRQFNDGDDVRAIDWRVTARTGRWHVKEYESLRRIPLILLVDTSASMRIGSQRPSKYEVAVRLAGGLALAGLQRCSPVGLVGAGESVVRHPPSLSHTQILLWLHQLRGLAEQQDQEGTRLAQRLDDLAARLKSRCLVIVLSDLHDAAADDALRRLHLVHDCALLVLSDPLEHQALRAGLVDAREAESDTRHRLVGASRLSLMEPRLRALAGSGIDLLPIAIDQPLIGPVSYFFANRGRQMRSAR